MKTPNIPFPKGILFDMDGVLLIPSQRSDQSWQQACQQFAPVLDIAPEVLEQALRESREAYQRDIAHDSDKQRRDRLEPFATRRETVERGLQRIGKENTALATAMVHAYETIGNEHRHLAPHALDILKQLRKFNIPLALISNGNASYQRQKIERYRLASFFDTILIEEEFGVAKPDQRIFLAALDHLHVAAHETWMVGDDLMLDIAASQQLGIFAIWFDLSQKGLPKDSSVHPDRIIHSLPELLA